MIPFGLDPDWYEKFWYSQKPTKKTWRVTSVAASLAALALAVWLH